MPLGKRPRSVSMNHPTQKNARRDPLTVLAEFVRDKPEVTREILDAIETVQLDCKYVVYKCLKDRAAEWRKTADELRLEGNQDGKVNRAVLMAAEYETQARVVGAEMGARQEGVREWIDES